MAAVGPGAVGAMGAGADGFATRRYTRTSTIIPRPRLLGTTTTTTTTTTSREKNQSQFRNDNRSTAGGDKLPRHRMLRLKETTRAHDFLSIVSEDPLALTPLCVSTAFNRLGRIGKSPDFLPRRFQKLPADETFRQLCRLVAEHAEYGRLDAKSVAIAMHGIAKLHDARRLGSINEPGPVRDALRAMDVAVGRGGEAGLKEDMLDAQHISMISWAYAKLGMKPKPKSWEALNEAWRRTSPELNPQAVANIMWAWGTLGVTPEDAARRALYDAVLRQTPNMKPQEVSNLVWGYATLGDAPSPEIWQEIDTAVARTAPDMTSQGVSNTLWGYAKFERMPAVKATRRQLEAATRRVAADMKPQEVSNVMYAMAKLGDETFPTAATWRVLETTAARRSGLMDQQEVTQMLWAYSTKKRIPETEETWEAIDAAVARVAKKDLSPQGIVQILLSYAALGRVPRDETQMALDAAVVARMSGLAPRAGMVEGGNYKYGYDMSSFVWAYALRRCLWGVEYPAFLGVIWDVIRRTDASAFTVTGLQAVFHAYLMMRESDSVEGVDAVDVAYPDWLHVEARDAWLHQVSADVTTSSPHKMLARLVGDLGYKHDVERITEDGFFSVDIYLPDYDVAIEFDGPSHYYSNYRDDYDDRHGTPEVDESVMRRTTKTQLRDFFLARRFAKLVTVPFYEFYRENEAGEERVREYVKNKLQIALAELADATPMVMDDQLKQHTTEEGPGPGPSAE